MTNKGADTHRVGYSAAVRVDNIDRLDDKGSCTVLGEHGHNDVEHNLGFGLRGKFRVKLERRHSTASITLPDLLQCIQ